MHNSNPGYQRNNHWCVCEICGFDYRTDDMKTTWDGKNVCAKDWESRHPQEIIRTKADTTAPVGIATGEPEPTYVSVTYMDTDADSIPSSSFNATVL